MEEQEEVKMTRIISDFKSEISDVAIDLRSKKDEKIEQNFKEVKEEEEAQKDEAAMPKPDTTTSIVTGKTKPINTSHIIGINYTVKYAY